jgi:hypothetical protein
MNVYNKPAICKKCGGECCKNMGCHFSPDDFQDLSYESLKKEIQHGNISIDYWHGDINEKKNCLSRTYYLRMKNKGAKIVDPSWGGQCNIWNPTTGCPLPFEKRPKGARLLIPFSPSEAKYRCEAEYTKEMCVTDWRKHHETLKKLAKYFNKPEEENL